MATERWRKGKRVLRRVLSIPALSFALTRPLRLIRGFLPRHVERLPVVGRIHVRFPELEKEIVLISDGQDSVARELFWHGPNAWEPEVRRALAILVPGVTVFFDVGANTGIWSIFAGIRNPKASIFSFEPVPESQARLRLHARLNGMNNVEVVPCAVTSTSGPVRLYLPQTIGDTTPLEASLSAEFRPGSRPILVDGITLDEFITTRNLATVDLIKIDVEGNEDVVIHGALEVLKKYRPTIICEAISSESSPGRVESALEGLGYLSFWLDEAGVTPEPSPAPVANRLFIHSDRKPLVRPMLIGPSA